MAGIRLGGLTPGLDVHGVVAQLMSVERVPRMRISLEQAAATRRQSLLQDIGAKALALRNATDGLRAATTWLDSQTVSSTDPTKVDVRRTAGAAPGGYDVTVTQLAAAERRTYGYQPPAAAAQLQILNGDGTLRTAVTLAAGATVNDAAAAINATMASGLFAVNVSGQLVLAARTTGVASGFSVTGAGAQVDRVAGQDALFQIGTTAYARPSNVMTDVLPGLELTLKARTAGSVGISVGTPGPDKNLIVSKVEAFVDAYNSLLTAGRGALGERRVPAAASTADAQKGTLFGDSGLRTMLATLRSAIGEKVTGLPRASSLAEIGIGTGAPSPGAINRDAVEGRLTCDSTKLAAALVADPAGVRKLLGGDPATPGFAQAFSAVLSPYTATGGVLDARATAAGHALARLQSRLTAFDARLDARQAFYEKRFTALEGAMSRSDALGTRLRTYLGARAA